ncbi:uncharacterized protein LACBIDRAFT_318019 [Laccaria bicolor S238N-H82]|uniref:Predicted protein n=1 Tax=Laccaria bicolor (strain S238N-H82 / ATCC MYA-4686) TaxID=486041 RepID=B0D5S4_LACBS|nr:uncharacterized protein LACBIDRAFT_318019 [Laccaria bicolor S238N-H82]EDR10069.1 predicted protein [Laccaria bicolor S238N-H82]|eukprot:XP_001879454.1 predicted protein [Laccaria bicolor S238N-H82]
MRVDIPTEVLLHVSKYIPDDTLKEMLAVNRVFYDLAMNLRYGDMLIATRKINTLKHLVRLQYPEVAQRVRRLEIRLSLMKPKGKEEHAPESPGSVHTIRQTLNEALRLLRPRGKGAKRRSPPHLNEKRDPFTVVINELSTAFPLMTNVQELLIDSWDLPPQYDLHPFLSSAWASFGSKLHTASLCGNLEGYRVLIESNPPFAALKHLRMEFTNNLFRVDLDADRAILVDIVAPFVCRLGPQLESLKVWSWMVLDLSAFFLNIGPFERLEYLNVRTAFNRAFREDAGGLKRVLCGSSKTLKRVDLRLNPSGSAIDPTSEGPLGTWLLECLEDERCLAGACALDVYPTNLNLPSGMDILLKCVERTREQLTELVVRDRYLNPEEIGDLLEALRGCRGLTYLRLNVWRMNVSLFDVMAVKAPGLRRLWLSVGDAVSNDPSASLENLRNEIQTRRFTEWKIEDLTIWQGGAEIDGDTMKALAKSIPSVNSFWGTGHTRIDP